MATAKRKKATKKVDPQEAIVSSDFREIRTALHSGVDAVIVMGTLKRDEVRVRPHNLIHASSVGRFAFLEYHPERGLRRVRVFVDSEDTGVEKRSMSSAMIYAVAHLSRPKNLDSDSVLALTNSVCLFLGIDTA